MPFYLRKKQNRERHENLTEFQLKNKRRRDKEYREKLTNN